MTKLFPYCVSFLLSFLITSSGSAQSSDAAKIDAYITPFAQAGHFSGVVLAARNGKPIFEKAYGFANAELGVRNTIDTRIGIASITKSMTSVIVRKLIEERKLSLDDKLSKFIPDFPSGDKITIDMLFRHRSGIPHRVMPPENETIPYTTAEMVERIKKAKLEFEPGTRDLYSSAGYTVLARVLEIASGKTYSDLINEYVFAPAGMKNSVEFSTQAIIPRRASDYLLDIDGPFNAPWKDYSFLVGAGSVLSTARDVHTFAMALVNGIYGDSVRANYLRTKSFSSNGSTNGHRAEVRVNGEHNYSYALVSNLNSGANDAILQALRDILEGKAVAAPIVPRPKLISLENTDLAQYFGNFETETGSRFDLTVKDGTLYAGDVKLLPTAPDCFFEFKYYGSVCFARDSSRKITHITWVGTGFTLKWVKK